MSTTMRICVGTCVCEKGDNEDDNDACKCYECLVCVRNTYMCGAGKYPSDRRDAITVMITMLIDLLLHASEHESITK